jgi:hypothetical protein
MSIFIRIALKLRQWLSFEMEFSRSTIKEGKNNELS